MVLPQLRAAARVLAPDAPAALPTVLGPLVTSSLLAQLAGIHDLHAPPAPPDGKSLRRDELEAFRHALQRRALMFLSLIRHTRTVLHTIFFSTNC